MTWFDAERIDVARYLMLRPFEKTTSNLYMLHEPDQLVLWPEPMMRAVSARYSKYGDRRDPDAR